MAEPTLQIKEPQQQPPSRTDGFVSPLVAELMCPICLELMNRPTTLACGHSGCVRCITTTIFNTGGRCPQCRVYHREPLAINVTMQNIIDHVVNNSSTPNTAMVSQTELPSEEEQAIQLRDAILQSEKSNLLNMLLSGYNPDSRIKVDGNNALAHAARHNRCEFIQLLLDKGADVNLQDSDGDTALMNAAYFRCHKPMKVLLACGADPIMMASSGLTALDYAKRPGYHGASPDEAMVELLETAIHKWTPPPPQPPVEAPVQLKPEDQEPMMDEDQDHDDALLSRVIAFPDGPTVMTVTVAAPMVREGPSPYSQCLGRLTRGDKVQATAFVNWGGGVVCYVR